MFSTVCDVYAPMYRQVTLNGDQSSYNSQVETAYKSAKAAFRDYLKNYNDGRGFIMIGHSQGSAHTARLIDELVDTNAKLRKRFVGAIAPGANISVPIGEAVGGLFDHVPACTEVGEYGCVIAFSTYNDVPGANAEFSRVDAGYWIYPESRPDSSEFEVMCTEPGPARRRRRHARAAGQLRLPVRGAGKRDRGPMAWPARLLQGRMQAAGRRPLAEPVQGRPRGRYAAGPRRGRGSGSNYHVPEVNLAEGNLLTIAQLQTDSYEARIAGLKARLERLRARLVTAKERLVKHRKTIKKLSKKLQDADGGKDRRILKREIKKTRGKAKAARKRISSLKEKIAEVEQQLG